jgi:GTP cyclohydrolase FolE2
VRNSARRTLKFNSLVTPGRSANAWEKLFLANIQSAEDTRNLKFQRVGVKGLICPMSVRTADGGFVDLRIDLAITKWVRIAEEEASCEVYGLLKRPDEKYVTERTYDNPKFVEDLVRDIALRLKGDSRIARFTVESGSFESIHNHSAYPLIEGANH